MPQKREHSSPQSRLRNNLQDHQPQRRLLFPKQYAASEVYGGGWLTVHQNVRDTKKTNLSPLRSVS